MRFSSSFQPTYKGLKLVTTGKCHLQPLCFQPTYKGLKLISKGFKIVFYKGFQPTYKGLKQEAKDENLKRAIRVFSLPIRD